MEDTRLAPRHDLSQGHQLMALPWGDERDEGGTSGYSCAEVHKLHSIVVID
ncbi:hypothetical protein QR685DRAFT_451276 [Neurospora intermedia]|uniref:Uncharacterized protein n=1 Tax=Neurospora intermedia TaxID=5142 RepID=A0ABR3D132_NEUIN